MLGLFYLPEAERWEDRLLRKSAASPLRNVPRRPTLRRVRRPSAGSAQKAAHSLDNVVLLAANRTQVARVPGVSAPAPA